MSEPTPDWIAELRVILVHPDGRRVSGHIAIGKPYVLGGGDLAAPHEAHCRVEIDSLFSRPMPAIGAGTLSALVCALQLVGAVLHGFIEAGGRVLDADDGSEIELKYLLGPLFGQAKPPDSDA